MPVDLYYLPSSIPCRSVMMLAKALGIHLNLKMINLLEGEHMKPEFDKMNPQHTVPTINDNGLILWESRAIMGYFVEKYAKNDSYYPKDPESRGTVDQRLYFDLGTLNNSLLKTYVGVIDKLIKALKILSKIYPRFPVIFGKTDAIDEQSLSALEKAFEILNTFLEGSTFVAGDRLTIADFSVITTVSTAEVLGFDVGRYDNVADWYQRCKGALADFGYEEINVAGAKMLGEIFQSRQNQ